MAYSQQLNDVLEQLQQLEKRHKLLDGTVFDIGADVQKIKQSIYSLQVPEPPVEEPEVIQVVPPPIPEALIDPVMEETEPELIPDPLPEPKQKKPAPAVYLEGHQQEVPKKEPKLWDRLFDKVINESRNDLERFMGENLINKIGIVILMLGIGIGAKYAIDRELISPLWRIVMGYLSGGLLVGISLKLKRNYHDFSAVLLSGGIGILYFMTYFAHSLYGFIPVVPAFGIMAGLTAVTVFAALRYDKQIIAHLGLIGAYAVPFLLGSESANYVILFSYMAILNVGILALALRRDWILLFYTAFSLTWCIYGSLYLTTYTSDRVFEAMSFGSIFFLIFYITFIAYKLVKGKVFNTEDVVVVLLNSFIFYGAGYAMLTYGNVYDSYTGLFTVLNAMMHSGVAFLFYRTALTDRSLQLLTGGIALGLLTVAVPIQFSGSWITLVWAVEIAVLFYVGNKRKSGFNFYHNLSLLLAMPTSFSLWLDWGKALQMVGGAEGFVPFLHIEFVVSLLTIGALGWMTYLLRNGSLEQSTKSYNPILDLTKTLLPMVFIMGLYVTFLVELYGYFEQWYYEIRQERIKLLSEAWVITYSMVYVAIVSLINQYKVKSKKLAQAVFIISIVGAALFAIVGMSNLHMVHADFLAGEYSNSFIPLLARYASLSGVALLLFAAYRNLKSGMLDKGLTIVYDLTVCGVLLISLSTEMIQAMDFLGYDKSDRLLLSVLWGLFAMGAVAAGIYQKKKYLRIVGLALFGLTLVKLFMYDITRLETVTKIIIMVSLGVLLLLISFMYNKYKDRLWVKQEENDNKIEEETV